MDFGLLRFLQEITCSGCTDPVFRMDNPGDKIVIREDAGERIYCGTCVATSELKSMIKPTDYVLEIVQTGKEPKRVK